MRSLSDKLLSASRELRCGNPNLGLQGGGVHECDMFVRGRFGEASLGFWTRGKWRGGQVCCLVAMDVLDFQFIKVVRLIPMQVRDLVYI